MKSEAMVELDENGKLTVKFSESATLTVQLSDDVIKSLGFDIFVYERERR